MVRRAASFLCDLLKCFCALKEDAIGIGKAHPRLMLKLLFIGFQYVKQVKLISKRPDPSVGDSVSKRYFADRDADLIQKVSKAESIKNFRWINI
jgi:hypothetical protein